MAEPKKFSELNIKVETKKLIGIKQPIRHVLEKQITVHAYRIEPSRYPGKSEHCLYLQYSHEGKMYVAFSIAKHLMDTLKAIPKEAFPFTTTITNKNEMYEFE